MAGLERLFETALRKKLFPAGKMPPARPVVSSRWVLQLREQNERDATALWWSLTLSKFRTQ